MAVIELLGCLVFDTPRTPRGQKLNLDGYSLVFFDDFDGGSAQVVCWLVPTGGKNHETSGADRPI